jgi:4'-phosphopantetheinyl transferase
LVTNTIDSPIGSVVGVDASGGSSLRVVVDDRGRVGADPTRIRVWLLEPAQPSAESFGRYVPSAEATMLRGRGRSRQQARLRTRGALRFLLGEHLGTDPLAVPIRTDANQPPRLVDALTRRISFSVSHTSGLAAIAIGEGVTVGVDVERRRPRQALDELARAVLAPDDLERYRRMRTADRVAFFYDEWCIAESYAKLTGRGLGPPFAEPEIDHVRAGCSIWRLQVPAGYSGAAVARPPVGSA